MATILDFLIRDELAIQATYSARVFAGGGASGSGTSGGGGVGDGGGGPAPERTIPAKGASLIGQNDFNPSDSSAHDFNPSGSTQKDFNAKGKKLDQLDATDVDACDESSDVHAVSPPGWSGTVQHMKDKGIAEDSAFKLAWSMYKKGDKSHKAPEKGHPGAQHLSKSTRQARSHSLAKKS